MRNKFISDTKTVIEKEFWKQFFVEVDKRHFLDADFKVKDFGLRINNKHLKGDTKNYSLMYTREGTFVMNKKGLNGKKWDGLNRLKNWCAVSGLPEKFYSKLNKKGLLSLAKKNSEIINIPLLLKSRTPSEVNEDIFQCVDLFQ
jgi:hypothetical protein